MSSLSAFYFAGIVSSACFFGVYIILTFTAIHLLIRRERTVTTIVMMVLTIVMFGVSTTYFALDCVLVSDGVLNPQKYPGIVIDLWSAKTTTQIICQGINSVLGDSIVIWRAWVVWGRQLYVVIIPLAFLLGVAFSSFGMAFAQSRASTDPNYLTLFEKSMIVLPCLTLATNVAATTLVLWRVCALHFSMKKLEHHGTAASHGTVQYRRLLKILIESGGLYCLTWLLLLCFILSGSPAAHVCLSIIGQLTGIYPTLIIVLVSLNLTQDHIQGPVVDTGIKFDRNAVANSTLTRTVSFTLAHASRNPYDGDGEVGVALVTGDGAECGIDSMPSPDCPSTQKGYDMHKNAYNTCEA
ncbi:hypothetical protein B0F90DRAFT_1817086 [Multifurca ochricompacta]|uniref:Uncharacterized protein n=1 Tax=Multifurca ochricompacta TaxID=376703 RepID=A0AAD4M483_9AGAM|nr:hypothetical protein B0F90DRAFT_1817086 [Multifurca ochricompacta]